MKRDMELTRQILFQVEESPHARGWVELNLPGHTEEEVSEHVRLLTEAGLLKATDVSTRGNFEWKPSRLTWEGHEFLNAIKNDTVWNNVKQTVKEKGGAIPFLKF